MPDPITAPLTVEVWSDVACPWCYIGKRRLEGAIAAFAAEVPDAPPVEVTFRSFQLSPDTPAEFDGSAVDFLSRHKNLTEAQVRQMHAHVATIAAGEGLHYDFDVMRMTNTSKAHQVLHLAKARGVQPQVKERLLRAHFVEGHHIGRDDDLVTLAAEAGLDPDEALASLRDMRYADAVQGDIDLARRIGIDGVPFFAIDGRYAVSGAQPAALLAQALRRAHADRLVATDAP